jgi:hypothetical protein
MLIGIDRLMADSCRAPVERYRTHTLRGENVEDRSPTHPLAQNLAGRIIRADPFDPSNSKDNWAMITSRNTTTAGKYGLQPGRTVFGDAERTQEEEFLHEGIHQSLEERKALGFFGSRRMDKDPGDHQDAYNNAANSFLGPGQ